MMEMYIYFLDLILKRKEKMKVLLNHEKEIYDKDIDINIEEL